MKRLSLNFTWQPDRRPLRFGLLLLVLAVEVGLWVGWQAVDVQRSTEDLQGALQAMQPKPEAPKATLSLEDKARQQAELKMAQGIIEHLDTPWGELFSAIDSAFDEQVTLLNIEPEAERREVQLTAEAKDLAAMQAYVRQIQASPALADAYLASHQINQQDPLRPVRFIVHARWIQAPVAAVAQPEDTIQTTDAVPDSTSTSVPTPAAVPTPESEAAPKAGNR